MHIAIVLSHACRRCPHEEQVDIRFEFTQPLLYYALHQPAEFRSRLIFCSVHLSYGATGTFGFNRPDVVDTLAPEEIVLALDALGTSPPAESTVRGYEGKINRQSVPYGNAASKRSEVAKIIAQSIGLSERLWELGLSLRF